MQGRKRPRFRSGRTKTSQIPISKVRKRPKFRSARYENVPDSDQQGRKRPKFRSARTKTSQIPISKTKTSQISISKDENVPDFDQQGRKRPRFRYNMFGFNAIKCDFWENMRKSAIRTKICGIMRRMENYAELCGGQKNVRYRTHRT